MVHVSVASVKHYKVGLDLPATRKNAIHAILHGQNPLFQMAREAHISD